MGALLKHSIPLVAVLLLLAGSGPRGQTAPPRRLEPWEDIGVTNRNAEPMHASFEPFDTAAQAVGARFRHSPWVQSLSGAWKFNWVRRPADRPRDFFRDEFDVSGWTDFPVPGNWETKGFGEPVLFDEAIGFPPYPPKPPYVPGDDNPVGSYRRTFRVPASWRDREVFLHTTRYSIRGTGEIEVEASLMPGRADLPELPRVGMRMVLPPEFDTITWFGRGPHENYWDRKTGAAIGIYSGRVADQIHPYVRPQESGYKTDVRWVALTRTDGTGLMAVGRPTLSTGATPFLYEDYDSARGAGQRRTIDMRPRDLVAWNIDLAQMGVGGDTSWGAKTHPEYTLPARPYCYRFVLRPLDGRDGAPAEVAKRPRWR